MPKSHHSRKGKTRKQKVIKVKDVGWKPVVSGDTKSEIEQIEALQAETLQLAAIANQPGRR